jgi:antitoxin YefM
MVAGAGLSAQPDGKAWSGAQPAARHLYRLGAVEIISNHGRAYLVAADDYESMEETDYLKRSPANAARLMTAADEVRRGRTLLTKTIDELQDIADDGDLP